MPRYINPRKTWFYSNEFKVRAVKLIFHPDNKVKNVAEGLGIHPMMLRTVAITFTAILYRGINKRKACFADAVTRPS